MLKPMLAGNYDERKLQLPVYVQTKHDGIRCLVDGGIGFSRTLKPLPNRYIQSFFDDNPGLHGLDGELIVGPPNALDVYNKSESGVMSQGGEPNFTYYVFDRWDVGNSPYSTRLDLLIRDLGR